MPTPALTELPSDKRKLTIYILADFLPGAPSCRCWRPAGWWARRSSPSPARRRPSCRPLSPAASHRRVKIQGLHTQRWAPGHINRGIQDSNPHFLPSVGKCTRGRRLPWDRSAGACSTPVAASNYRCIDSIPGGSYPRGLRVGHCRLLSATRRSRYPGRARVMRLAHWKRGAKDTDTAEYQNIK